MASSNMIGESSGMDLSATTRFVVSAVAGSIGRAWRALALLPIFMVGGCSAVDVVNALVPRSDFEWRRDLAYGEGPRQTLDVYLPKGATAPLPVIVFFYGGNWDNGEKADYLFVGQALASRGFIVVIPDYRLFPQVRYPAFLEDNAKAVAWILAHLGEFGGDPKRVSLMGHSAGAYNAAMLALDGRWLGADRARIRKVVVLGGPYDFLPLTDPELQTIFGTEPDLPRTQPINFVDNTAPPMFLAAGTDDTTVRPGNTTRLAAKLRERSVAVTERHYQGVSHVMLIGSLAAPLRFKAPVLDDVSTFLSSAP